MPNDIEFNPKCHEYIHKPTGRKVPSVTQILAEIRPYDGIDKGTLDNAAIRGSLVHRACELYDDNDLEITSIDSVIGSYLNGWIDFRKDTGATIQEFEMRVFNQDLFYAGTLDRIVRFPDGKLAVVEIKTSCKIEQTTGMQLAAYAECCPTLPGDAERLCVQLLPDGRYNCRQFNGRQWFKHFKTCLSFYNLRKELGYAA